MKTVEEVPQQTLTLESIKAELIETYGPDSDKEFDELIKKHPEWSLERAIEEFKECPTNQQTSFFRTSNLKYVAKELAPKLEKKEKPIKILDIGCSSGEEVYSLAVDMLEEKIENFEIKGIDSAVNPLAVAEMGEYKIWAGSMNEIGFLDSSRISQDYIKKGYFEDSNKRWDRRESSGKYSSSLMIQMLREKMKIPDDAWNHYPQVIIKSGEKIKKHISFDLKDILSSPTKEAYDIIVMNHVLIHYPAKTADKIMINALKSLRPGGFIVLEPKMRPLDDHERNWLEPYNDWRDTITDKFPLKEIEDGNGYSTNQYFQFLGFE